ncbi:ATP-binding protein [Parvularcula lutaonensis]|uniref:histidine kinase n=1 Tax=Parvularcula lutaonensis TaxID=491923 RepID=A0ABV7MFX6_9PROT|nr:ATP-binding protein [Parvularcula lutaonensis]GGY54566.1 hypothetical protein GCM10007148_25290 [Parvularcula lutaonensis]
MGHEGDSWRRSIAWRYRAAVCAVALVVTAASFLQFRMITAERERAEFIALAAEQATLSQRIAFLAANLDPEASACTDPFLCAELLDAAERMERNHALLTGADPERHFARYVPAVAPIYASGSPTFASQVEAFAQSACRLARDALDEDTNRRELILNIRMSGSSTIMQTHALVVEVLEAEARRAIRVASYAGLSTWGLAIAILVVLSNKVFAPMVSRLAMALNQMVDARNDAIAAAEKAERANRARAEFLRSASHELKTPLNAIIGLSDVLREEKDGTDVLLSEVANASDHLLSTLNTMLDTHRLDEGELELADEPVHLAEHLKGVVEIPAPNVARKGLDFKVEIDVPDDLVTRGDANRLRQVCLNLLDNAVRFTKQGHVAFSARIENETSIVLVIEDTGIGISKARRSSVFTRYSSQPEHKSAVAGGIGLGLSLTKTLTELMGGEIALHTELGKGTRFDVRLPLNVGDTVHGASWCREANPLVLVVDDNTPNRLVVDAMMKMLGARGVMATNGREAVRAASEEAFDLILMDIAMPVMDGIAATRAIRAGEGPNRHTPIVAVTAHIAPEDVHGLIEEGFQAVIHKPVRKKRVADIFSQYLSATIPEDATARDAG